MKYLVNDPMSVEFLDSCQLDSTLKVLLGDPESVDTMVRPEFLSARLELQVAAKKVAGLAQDPTRTDVAKHHAGQKLGEAVVAKLAKARAALEQRADHLEKDALHQADLVLGPKADRGHLETEIRDWLWEIAKKPGGLEKIKKAMAESEDLARILWHSPRFLTNLSEETHQTLRFEALRSRQPELYANLASAMHLTKVAAKVENVIHKSKTAFYNTAIASQAAKRVEV
jgi:hypothetical protein